MLEANKQAYALAFVQRADFLTTFPNSMTADQFVTKLETNAGGNILSPTERTNLINVLGATPSDATKRAQVLRAVAEDKDLENAEFNKAFVLMQYFGYLRRDPDTIGYDNWLTTLTADPSNFRHMIFGFLFSNEYRGRFGP